MLNRSYVYIVLFLVPTPSLLARTPSLHAFAPIMDLPWVCKKGNAISNVQAAMCKISEKQLKFFTQQASIAALLSLFFYHHGRRSRLVVRTLTTRTMVKGEKSKSRRRGKS